MVTNSVTAPPEGTVEPSAAVALPREVTDRVSVMKVPVSASGWKKKYLNKLLELPDYPHAAVFAPNHHNRNDQRSTF
ncbi:hypothetical protein GGH92_000156 [Coemansia sp. RSA 2673]|nr:hypothetical protein GGH92_000156 [Coemansia sp. RSA 2673]